MSHLEYGINVWASWKLKDIERLEQSWEGLMYEERLRSLGLPTLVYKRVRSDMIMVYNIPNGPV